MRNIIKPKLIRYMEQYKKQDKPIALEKRISINYSLISLIFHLLFKFKNQLKLVETLRLS